MQNRKDRKIQLQLLNPTHLVSIDFFPDNPDKMVEFHYKDVNIKLEEIDPNNQQQLATHIQDLIIARQIDRKLFAMLKHEFPEALNREFIFPEIETMNLFHVLSENSQKIAEEGLNTGEYLDEQGLLARAHLLAIIGKYAEAKLILSDLGSILSEMDVAVNLQIQKELEFLNIIDTPFECHESYVEEKKVYMPTMFQPVAEIPWACKHNIANYWLHFQGNSLQVNFSLEENMALTVTEPMKRAILQCQSSAGLIEIFESAASQSNNEDYSTMVAILESYDEAASFLNLKTSKD